MLKTMLKGITLAFVVSAAHAADSLQFTCTGDMIEPAGLARAPITVNAVLLVPQTKCRRCPSIWARVASTPRY